MKPYTLIACHDCDLLHRLPPLQAHEAAKCVRCRALLHRHRSDSVNRTLALALAAFIFFVIANYFPFLSLRIGGQIQETTLITGAIALYRNDMEPLAILVAFTSILAPLIQIAGLLYVLLPLKYGRLPRKLAIVFRLVLGIQPWAMMEVFMLGILVAIVKLVKMATIVPGLALYAFMALIFLLAASLSSLDPHRVWESSEQRR